MVTVKIRLHFIVMCAFSTLLLLTLSACQPIFVKVPPETQPSPTVEPDLSIPEAISATLQIGGKDHQGKDMSVVYAVDVDVQGNFDKDTLRNLTQTYKETTRLESLLVCDSRNRTWTLYVNETPPNLATIRQVSEHVVIPSAEDDNVFEIVNGRMFNIASTVTITSTGDLSTVIPGLSKHFSQLTGLPASNTNVMPRGATTAMLLLSTEATGEPSSPSKYTLVPFVNVDAQCNEQVPGGIFDCVEWCSGCIKCGWYCALC